MRFRVLKNSGQQKLASYFTAEIESETTNKVTQEAVYNFRVDELERSGLASNELFLPSHYWFSSTTNLKKYLGALPYNPNTKKQLVNGQYFKELGRLFEESPGLLSELAQSLATETRYKIFFIEEDVIKDAGELYRSFPVYNRIRLQTLPHQLNLAKSLKEEGLLEKFCKRHIARILEETKPPILKEETKFFIDLYDLGKGGELPAALEPFQINYLASTEEMSSNPAVIKNQTADLNSFTILTDDVAKEHTKISQLSAMKMTSTFQKWAKDDQLDILMFEIRKYKVSPGEPDTFVSRIESEQLLQQFFIPAFSDDINFVDTQVRQGVHYHYQVIAHVAIGSKNSIILGLPWDNTIDDFANPVWKEISKAAVKILTPRNSSPLSPELDIIPFDRSDQSVTILLKNRYGSELSKPILIENEDGPKFSPAVPLLDTTGEILFKTDETEVEFEVFRIDEMPESYRSFAPVEETRIGRWRSSSAISFGDAIEPNKDYYYCARTIDLNGNISNPTNVIKVRIVSVDDSLPYFTKKSYDFSEFSKKYEKFFQKYLLIRPSEFQSTLVDGPNGPRLAGDIFGKRIVLEIESKKTGRKIDFVVKFNPPIRKPPSSAGVQPPKKPEKLDLGDIKIGEIPKEPAPALKEDIIIKDKFPKKPSLVDDMPGNFKDDKIDPFKVQPKK